MNWEQGVELINLILATFVCIATVSNVAVALGWHDPNHREVSRLATLAELTERLPDHRRRVFEAELERRLARLERRLTQRRTASSSWWVSVVSLGLALIIESLQLIILGPGGGTAWTMPLFAFAAVFSTLSALWIFFLRPFLPAEIRLGWRSAVIIGFIVLIAVVEALRTDNETQWVASQMTIYAAWIWPRLAAISLGILLLVYVGLLLTPRTRHWLIDRVRSTLVE